MTARSQDTVAAMPIRFRCAYCNQLMGIARRKAGSVVRCPTCGGQVVVPNPNEAPVPQGSAKRSNLFENTDFDKVLQDSPKLPPAPNKNNVLAPKPAKKSASVDVEPVSMQGILQPSGFSAAKFLLMTIVLCVLLGLAFLAGFLVGRTSLE